MRTALTAGRDETWDLPDRPLKTDATSNRHQGSPLLSVIVVSYNACHTICPCLESLRRQWVSAPFQVIVVDSSDDETPDIVHEQFAEMVFHHSSKRLFCGDARNIGVRIARAPYIAFIDADCIAAPDWVDQIVRAFEADGILALGGSISNAEAFRLVRRYGAKTKSSNMIGIPGETRQSVFETIVLNTELAPDSIGHCIFQPYPGTLFHELCSERGYIEDDIYALPNLFSRSIVTTAQLSKRDVRNLFLLADITRAFRPFFRALQRTSTVLLLAVFRLLLALIPVIEKPTVWIRRRRHS